MSGECVRSEGTMAIRRNPPAPQPAPISPTREAALGPAERILTTLLSYQDHMYHGRPGIVVRDATNLAGVTWRYATWKLDEAGVKQASFVIKAPGKKTKTRTVLAPAGVIGADNVVRMNGAVVGTYRQPGPFAEVITCIYQQIAEVWQLDNEFVARWASYALTQDHRDFKAVIAAFLLVQPRCGAPIRNDDGTVAFADADYRDVAEAMLLGPKGVKKALGFDPKMLLQVRTILTTPGVAAINRALGFGVSAREPPLGRWPTAARKWLAFREENPATLAGLVKSGYKQHVAQLARLAQYKPTTAAFFAALGWRQTQAKTGHRAMVNVTIAKPAESWRGLTEAEICQRIVADKLPWKRVVSMASDVGVTRAVVVATLAAGGLTDRELIIITPTLEDLGLLNDPAVRQRWEHAVKQADDTRALNIANNVRRESTRTTLVKAADVAVQKAVAEVVKQIQVRVMIDISGSMQASIESAINHITKFVQAFPLPQLDVVVFNTVARRVTIPAASAAGVRAAFTGIRASGGTSHATAVPLFRPAGSDEDMLLIVVGDQGEHGTFAPQIRAAGLHPMAIGFVKVPGDAFGRIVETTAADLGIPLFVIDERTFGDAYAIPRTIRALVAATPVGARTATAVAAPRVSLVHQILNTPLLEKPVWA